MYIYESNNELLIKNVIDDIDINAKASYEVPNTKFVADFFLPSSNTLIEINGPSHYIKLLKD